MNRPPPYFPQNQLSPPDPNRYRRFKFVVGGLILAITSILALAGYGIYRLLQWLWR
ncbi:MAG: hypothetical protein ACKN97_01620 [Acidobacteriota bacterium]